jgi:hypothetical protein
VDGLGPTAKACELISIKTNISLLLILLLVVGAFSERASAQTGSNSGGQPSPPAADSDSPSWLFPIAKLDRLRLEGPTGIGFTGTNDFYLLDRLRVKIVIPTRATAVRYANPLKTMSISRRHERG